MDSLLSVSAAASLPLPASPVPGAVRIQGLAHIDLQQLPNHDALSQVLDRSFSHSTAKPFRDLSGNYSNSSIEALRAAKSYRALAFYARDHIVSARDDETEYLLELWQLRFEALQHLGLYSQLQQELIAVFHLFPGPSLDANGALSTIIPFPMMVLHARLPEFDGKFELSVSALWQLMEACKREVATSKRIDDTSAVQLWRCRLVSVGCLILNLLIQLKEYNNASSLCTALIRLQTSLSDQLNVQLLYIQLVSGNLPAAQIVFEALPEDRKKGLPGVYYHLANNEPDSAASLLDALAGSEDADLAITNARAVLALQQGNLSLAGDQLTPAPNSSPSVFYNSQTLMSNLITLSELLPVQGQSLVWTKERMLSEAAKWTQDGAAPVVAAFRL